MRAVEEHGLDGPLERWQALRAEMHAEICERAVDTDRGCFVRAYGSTELDASLLLLPLVGFLPPDDERIERTIDAVTSELCEQGLVRRYRTGDDGAADGLSGGEGAFLACSFWLVDALVLTGRREEAETLFTRLVGLCNDVGLLAEEYAVNEGRLVGNFPQAFSHVGLINSAFNLAATPQRTRQ